MTMDSRHRSVRVWVWVSLGSGLGSGWGSVIHSFMRSLARSLRSRLPQVAGAALLSYGGETYALKVLLNYAKLLNFNNETDRTDPMKL